MEKLPVLDILYEDNHLLVVIKPPNIPVCQDSSCDTDLLSILKKYLKKKYHKPGNVYLGLVHRLDRPVSGIMVFAKTSKAAQRLAKQLQNKQMIKTYYAITYGMIKKEDTFIDYLIKDKETNTSYVTNKVNGKLAILHYQLIARKNNLNLVKINLETGRHHQIRVQFASRNYFIYADHRYQPLKKDNQEDIALIAKTLSFYHPISKKPLTFNIDLPNKYPWNIF